MESSSKMVETIVSSAAEKDGEFLVPLSKERIENVQKAIDIHFEDLDDHFLITLQGWLKKSNEDGLAGMVRLGLLATVYLISLVE